MNSVTGNNSHHSALVGRHLSLVISEPWEFEDEAPSPAFAATITDVYVSYHARQHSEKLIEQLLVRLDRPFGYKKLKTEYLIASPRHEGFGLKELSRGGAISFNFCRASSEQAASDEPFDRSRWKNVPSFGLTGTLKLQTAGGKR